MKAKSRIGLSVARDFSRTPGPRYVNEGDFSGELFRKEHLKPMLSEAIEAETMLEIDLDGTAGYGTSFLEEAFGGLIREDGYQMSTIMDHLDIISTEENYLRDDIISYMRDAEDEN